MLKLIQKLNITESELSPRLRTLFVKTKMGIYGELLLKNEVIDWFAKSKLEREEEAKDVPTTEIFRIIQILQFNASKANDMAGLEEARALEYILPTDILRKEFRHNIEIIEKLILERADRADVPEPEQNRSKENTPDIQAYKLLLANNMKTVFTELQKIKADMNKAIEACLSKNTTSVFKYSCENAKLVGKIEDIAEQSLILFAPGPDYDKALLTGYLDFAKGKFDETTLNDYLKQKHEAADN